MRLSPFASPYLDDCENTTDYPLPSPGETRFFIRTFDHGVRTAAAAEDALGNNHHKLSPLFLKAHELIAAIRIVEEKRRMQ